MLSSTTINQIIDAALDADPSLTEEDLRFEIEAMFSEADERVN